MVVFNDVVWNIQYVKSNSPQLRRSDGVAVLGVTDNSTHTVYVNNNLNGQLLEKVITHELVHCAMFSYCIYIPIEQEEFIADYIATYGREIFSRADDVLRRVAQIM